MSDGNSRLGSNTVTNFIAGLAAVLSGIALFQSCGANTLAEQSNSIAASANSLASDAAKKQGGLLQIIPGMIILQRSDGSGWDTYNANSGGPSPRQISVEQWRDARAWGISVRLENNGLQDGFPEEYYFVTGNGIYSSVNQGHKLDLKCRHLESDWAPCPDTIGPGDGYSLSATIPKELVEQITDGQRQRGLTLCVRARTGSAECGTITAVIPAGAAEVMP